MLSFWRRLTRRRALPVLPRGGDCPLSGCCAGERATIVCLACPAGDAARLRALGVFEGARIAVVHAPRGVLVDVRGARVALDPGIAGSITVRREVA